jgi:hypothetical protein
MIDAFSKVIDRLIQLVEYRDKRLRRVFDEVLTPIFKDLESIHNDYDSIFKETRALLPNKEIGLSLFNETARTDPLIILLPQSEEAKTVRDGKQYTDALEHLRNKREVFEPLRIKLRAMLPELKKIEINEEADDFIAAVINYFPSGINEAERKWSNPSVSYGLVRYMEHKLGSPSRELHQLIEHILYFNRQNWEEVCRSYMRLKVKAVSGA